MNGMIIARGTVSDDPGGSDVSTGRGRQGVTHQPRGAGSPPSLAPVLPDPERGNRSAEGTRFDTESYNTCCSSFSATRLSKCA